ncbi:MAG TPA: FAD-linked oxidase C-terminal domain-containing protein [Bryobacteraceae bacterium]|nr:FAD-linked oxidase C-terminal domain-containing protein [Bryobacteraceae bacterium]
MGPASQRGEGGRSRKLFVEQIASVASSSHPPVPVSLAAATVAQIEMELRASVQGEVRFDAGSRALYATDGSNYRQVPIGVTCPRNAADVEAILAVCRSHGAPVLPRGGGTSLAGQCCNVAVVMDFSKYMYEVLEVDADRRLGRVQPGTVLDALRDAAEKYHLTFGPDPATHTHCTLGGMVGNNSCGIHALMAGRTADNIHELEILTYDGCRMRVGRTSDQELESIIRQGGRRGEIYSALKSLRDRYADQIRRRYPRIPRRVSGYNLDELLPENGFHVARALVGSEGTCVTVLEVVGNLVHSPPKRSLLVLGYPDIYSAGDHIPEVLEAHPIGCEGIDDRLIGYYKKKGEYLEDMKKLPEGSGWLLVQFGADTKQEADEQARALMNMLRSKPNAPSMRLYDDAAEEQRIWELRESGLGATAWVPGEPAAWPGWEDSAVPPARVGPYLRDLRKLFEKHGYNPSVYGHLAQGCIHCRVQFDLRTKAGLDNYRSFMDEATSLVVSYGGSLSGEHGDGQARAEYLPKMFGEELVQAFREFKSIWDPEWKMNPGKIVDPYAITDNLRLGTDYRPPELHTHFHYPDDHGSFAHAALRCAGVGNCRREEGGTMCPSYMVTREEQYSTRGRARLLFEMLHGDPLTEGWRTDAVREALDLCLACKGCKSDCPVNVDMATYKAEFLAHYYERRLRPRHAYSMGLIYWWARLASYAPRVVNFLAHAPVTSDIAKAIGGIAPERTIPRFATETFRHWFNRRESRNAGGRRVLVWPDTFNNHFHPQVAQAAVEVLEHCGFQVAIPGRSLCCGRPLYDFGMLKLAKHLLREALDELSNEIENGVPVIGLEPSCLAVFRDEMVNLLPDDWNAKRLQKQCYTLSEFLEHEGLEDHMPRLPRKAVVHGHCHQKAVLTMKAEERLYERMGLDFEVLDSGCCGMAGSFGFEKDHYSISVACGERALLPAVRKSAESTLVIADGFSCREQISQLAHKEVRHTAEILRLAIDSASAAPARQPAQPRSRWRAVAASLAAIAAGVLLSRVIRQRKGRHYGTNGWRSSGRETHPVGS